ncbi:MAG TPA: cytochrome b/b6 domain-containing protein [Rhizomicrobium sp.]|nr:cytochrome b/b6 domain-containing protein [Rhizomicrobium sp.]
MAQESEPQSYAARAAGATQALTEGTAAPAATRRELFYRHTVSVRVLHWINALALLVMFMSGLQIFNAHPALYWGNFSTFAHPFVAFIGEQDNTGRVTKGVTWIGSWHFNTTGLLGASYEDGQLTARGFPAWATLPGPQWLAMGRLWHFFFAWIFAINGLAFVIYAFARRHAQKDLLPTRADLSHLGREIADHVRLRFPKGEAAKRYNALQKIAYFTVIFVFGPLIVLTGLTMAPTIDSAFPWLVWLFGGRQSARTIHFILAFSFLGFFIVHIVMVVLSGTWNNLRSIITGWYAIDRDSGETSHV